MTAPNPTTSREATERLIVQFYRYLDLANFAPLAKLFGADGEWHRQGEILRGEASVAAALAKRSPRIVSVHSVSNVLVEDETETTASATYFVTAYRHDPDHDDPADTPLIPHALGLYEIRTRRVGGAWQVAFMKAGTTFKR